MGWLWVLFVFFSVLGNLLEKMLTEQKASRPVKPGQGGDRPLPQGKPFPFPLFPMDKEEAESRPAASLPETEPEVILEPAGKVVPAELTELPREAGGLWADAEWDRLFAQKEEWGGADLSAAYAEGDTGEEGKSEAPEGRTVDARLFYDALILAHVLPRPDWRTAPWRRRL